MSRVDRPDQRRPPAEQLADIEFPRPALLINDLAQHIPQQGRAIGAPCGFGRPFGLGGGASCTAGDLLGQLKATRVVLGRVSHQIIFSDSGGHEAGEFADIHRRQ
jgi:hypothetical protein